MASRHSSQALRSLLSQLSRNSITNSSRLTPTLFSRAITTASTKIATKSTVTHSIQQARGMKTIDFAGTKEVVYGMFYFSFLLFSKETNFLFFPI